MNEKLDELKWKDRTTKNQIILTAISEYVEKHIDGNPAFTLDQFIDPDFKACPAFFRDKDTWRQYLSSLNEKEYKELDSQLNTLLNLANERFNQF